MAGERAKLLIGDIDSALETIAEALNRGQPPYSGKLVIKFVDEGAELKAPAVFKLAFTRRGDCLSFRVPTSRLGTRASSKSSFAINVREVRALLVKAEELMEKRKALIQRLKHFNHWEALYCSHNEKKVAGTHLEVKEIRSLIDAKLDARQTRASKEEERERLGIEVEVMDGKGRPVAVNARKRPSAKRKELEHAAV